MTGPVPVKPTNPTIPVEELMRSLKPPDTTAAPAFSPFIVIPNVPAAPSAPLTGPSAAPLKLRRPRDQPAGRTSVPALEETVGLSDHARADHRHQRVAAEVQACLEGASARVVIDQPDFGEWSPFLEKLERIRPDALLVDFTRIKEPYDDLITQLKSTSASPMIVALHTSADPETILSTIHAGADEYLYPPVSIKPGQGTGENGRPQQAAAGRLL